MSFRKTSIIDIDYGIRVFVLDDSAERRWWFGNRLKKYGFNLEKKPTDLVQIVSTFEQAKKVLAEKEFDIYFLDHDLSSEHYKDLEGKHEDTGLQVIDFIRNVKDAWFVIHTWNMAGRLRMIERLLELGVPENRIRALHYGDFDLKVTGGSSRRPIIRRSKKYDSAY